MIGNVKYFGIGLSRTGTTSLCSAFKMLGFKCVHYPQPKQLEFLDRYDFANDTPIPVRFQDLDKKFPNSKFIYTIRDMESWLKSCSEYFNSEKFKLIKSKYDFQEEYRMETYGILEFDEEIFRLVYEEHDKKVREHFKDRPEDLLTMNILEGEGWEKLMPFILKSDPDLHLPLPQTNKIVKLDQRKRQAIKNRLQQFKKSGKSKTEFPLIHLPDIKNGIKLFSAVKNEMIKLPNFLEYYRKLGVDRFFIIDNNSEDGTFEYLCEQDDVQTFKTDESFYYEKDWITSLLEKYGKDEWSILADADEMFIYPDYENIYLKDFCKSLDEKGCDAVNAVLVDLYSEKSVLESHYVTDENPLKTFNLIDTDSYVVTESKKIEKLNSGAEILRGGVHKRVFNRNYQLNKVPLIKYRSELKILTSGHHYVHNAKLAPLRASMLHFKLSSDLLQRAEKMQMDEEYHSVHYKKYYNILSDMPDLSLKYDGSVQFTGSKQLLELGLMK